MSNGPTAEPPGLSTTTLSVPLPRCGSCPGGEAESTLRRLEALTGSSIVLRGLDLSVRARPKQLERATALIELLRPLWQEGQQVSQVDLNTALQALDSGQERTTAP